MGLIEGMVDKTQIVPPSTFYYFFNIISRADVIVRYMNKNDRYKNITWTVNKIPTT